MIGGRRWSPAWGLLGACVASSALAQEAPAASPAAAPAAAPADVAAPASAPPPAAAPAKPDLKTGDEAHELKLKTLEERVNELKERIFRSKQRLAQLQEAVVGGVSSGAKARIAHRNDMGPLFRLKEMHYFLDGAPLRHELDESGKILAEKKNMDLFDGAIIPGNHQLTVSLVYRGSGMGVFSYLDGYIFKVRSSYTFTAEESKEVLVRVIGYEQGNVTAEMKDRPAVRYEIEIRGIEKSAAGKTGEPAGARP